jgi:putative Holliday junction resolvase
MIVAGLDVGKTRIGIAICDVSDGAIHPVTTIARRPRSLPDDLATLQRELVPRAVERIVVGLPLNMDGSEGPAARRMRGFATQLQQALELPVELCDERLTSFEARERLREIEAGPARRRRALDSLAAMLILENWLEVYRRSQR